MKTGKDIEEIYRNMGIFCAMIFGFSEKTHSIIWFIWKTQNKTKQKQN